jgi:hypothetical protein
MAAMYNKESYLDISLDMETAFSRMEKTYA